MHDANGGKLNAVFFVLYVLGPMLLPVLMSG